MKVGEEKRRQREEGKRELRNKEMKEKKRIEDSLSHAAKL